MDRPTVQLYESESGAYAARRGPTDLDRAAALGAARIAPTVADLGSGPGWHAAALGAPVVAVDAAASMLELTRAAAPEARGVQADLERLPFRRGALGGAWARNSYVHLRAADVPMALAELHGSLRVGAPVELTFFRGEGEGRGIFPDDDFPGRWFSSWSAERLHDVLAGAGFGVERIDPRGGTDGDQGFRVRAIRDTSLPDHVGPGMRLLVCGLNPSLHAAEAGVGYVTPGNRFWPAALAAGLVTRDRDPGHALRAHGMGMTDLVKRATPRAASLRSSEYREGVTRLDRLCGWLQPQAVCVVGLAGWRAAVDRRAVPGWQSRQLGDRPVYVMPSTSGLNAATPLADLVAHLRAAAST
jgi:TDG/mug DNA glycosylase family protein